MGSMRRVDEEFSKLQEIGVQKSEQYFGDVKNQMNRLSSVRYQLCFLAQKQLMSE